MTMKKLMSVMAGLFVTTSALAGWGVGVSVNIGSPVVYTPAPVVYAPAPVVYTHPVGIPRQVIYVPAPIVCAPAPVVYTTAPIGISYQAPISVYFPMVHHHHYHRH